MTSPFVNLTGVYAPVWDRDPSRESIARGGMKGLIQPNRVSKEQSDVYL